MLDIVVHSHPPSLYSTWYILTAQVLYMKLIERGLSRRAFYSSGAKVKPSGVRILSWTTLFATSPPRSRATAPTTAYSEVIRTDSTPEPRRLSACHVSVYCLNPFQSNLRTLFGFHRVTLSRPYRSAICESLALLKTMLSASSVKP
jgi:hypothetical protein